MAIPFDTAFDVVERCIRATGRLPRNKEISVDQKLEQVRITTQSRVDAMINRIANSNRVGLPSLEPPHAIDENLLLDVGTSSTVGEVVAIVGDFAVPEED
jgi:hypothetical protein